MKEIIIYGTSKTQNLFNRSELKLNSTKLIIIPTMTSTMKKMDFSSNQSQKTPKLTNRSGLQN